jgi:hypothetical protein
MHESVGPIPLRGPVSVMTSDGLRCAVPARARWRTRRRSCITRPACARPSPAQRLLQRRSARRNTTRMKTCLPQIENHLNMMKNRNNRAAAALPLIWTELALASWETIARRSLLMMSGTCSPDEYHRMAAEKLRALSRSTRGFASGRTGATAVAAAMRPWHGPATANAKRLRRK